MLASRFTLDARQADLLYSDARSTVREFADAGRSTGSVRATIASLLGWSPAARPVRLATR